MVKVEYVNNARFEVLKRQNADRYARHMAADNPLLCY